MTIEGRSFLLRKYGIQLSLDERVDHHDEIREELQKGYAYDMPYLAWRRVLKDFDGNMFLSDLGSLTYVKRSEHQTYKEIVDIFLEREGRNAIVTNRLPGLTVTRKSPSRENQASQNQRISDSD